MVLGRAVFSASEQGSLVYQTGAAVHASKLLWLDRTGKNVGVVNEACFCSWPRLSPNGRSVALAATDSITGNTDIYVYDLADRRPQRLTFEESWTRVIPPGRRTALASSSLPHATGSGTFIGWTHTEPDRKKCCSTRTRRSTFFEARADTIVFWQDDHFWLLPLPKGAREHEFRVSDKKELFGQVSPNGRWFVYQSNEGGKPEIFVTSFPGRTGKQSISEDGGMLPKWSRDGREIFISKRTTRPCLPCQ